MFACPCSVVVYKVVRYRVSSEYFSSVLILVCRKQSVLATKALNIIGYEKVFIISCYRL